MEAFESQVSDGLSHRNRSPQNWSPWTNFGSQNTGFTTKQDRGKELREIFKKNTISLDRLVIETDCPFMMPAIPKEGFQKVKFTEVKKGHNNEPCTLVLVANCIAQCYGVSVQEVVDITTKNTMKIL